MNFDTKAGMEAIDKAQQFIDDLRTKHGGFYAIIVHEVSMIRAIVGEMHHDGVDEKIISMVTNSAALTTSALVEEAGLVDKQPEIMRDVERLLELSVVSLNKIYDEQLGDGSSDGATIH